MNNETVLPEMSEEDATAMLQRVLSDAADRAQKAFQSGDRKRFDFWNYRAGQIRGIMAAEKMHEDVQKLKLKLECNK